MVLLEGTDVGIVMNNCGEVVIESGGLTRIGFVVGIEFKLLLLLLLDIGLDVTRTGCEINRTG